MDLASIDTIWLIIALLLLNLFLLVVFRTRDRYWHPPILLWLGLFFTLLLLHAGYGYSSRREEAAFEYQPSQDGYADAMLQQQLQEEKNELQLYRQKTFRLLGTQSFLALFLMGIGYHQTGQQAYRKAAVSFAFICLLYIVLEIFFLFNGFGG